MEYIKLGSKGELVEQWQYFLIGEEFYLVDAHGNFDEKTELATRQFQTMSGLKADGVVGPGTLAKAKEYGYTPEEVQNSTEPIRESVSDDMNSYDWPPVPDFRTLSAEKTEEYFGKIEYTPLGNGSIQITNGWDKKHIKSIYISQLNKINQAWGHDKGNILFHEKGARQMKALWDAWEKEGLLGYVTDWCCSYGPRFIRGSSVRLSNHAYGTAFDINIRTNALGKMPPIVGEKGSVRLLVPLANKFGFFWGGHYRNRKDGMHFELAKLL